MGVKRLAIGKVNLPDLFHGAHELREIFAIARGVIERVETRIHRSFGESDAV